MRKIENSKRFLVVGLLLLVLLAGASFGAATLDDIAGNIQQIQVAQAEFKATLAYLDWKLNLIIVLVVAILGFVFYLAREIGFGTREKIEKIKAYLEQVSDKLHLPKPILIFFLTFSLLASGCWFLVTPVSAVPKMINVQGRLY